MDRPGKDADASEIARWMEEDFGRALAEGVEQALSESTMTEAKKSLVAAVESVQRDEDVETKLSNLKERGQERWERDDVIWFEIVLSLATLQGSQSAALVVDKSDNIVDQRYGRVVFETIEMVKPERRQDYLRQALLDGNVGMQNKKAKALVKNFEFIKQEYGDPKGAKSAFEAQDGVDEKIEFLKQFSQIGPKYARNIGMDLYLPDFRYFIAVDSRIENIMRDAGFPYEDESYEEQEAFLGSVAEELGCEPWELDRILYHFETEVRAQL
jgi:endonuclease III